MRCVVVVEGKADAEIVKRLLGHEPSTRSVEVKAASGRSAADSMARTILARGERVVALMVDADTSNTGRVHELESWLVESLGMMAPREWFLVCVMVPEFESIFFKDAAALENATGHRLSSDERVRAQFEPKRVLSELLNGQEPTQVLTPALIDALRHHGEIRRLLEFIGKHTTQQAGSSAA